jgi:hypothetical protein
MKWACERRIKLIYYKMLKNVHVIFSQEEQINFWSQERYSQDEFEEAGLNIEFLLSKNLCKLDKPRHKQTLGYKSLPTIVYKKCCFKCSKTFRVNL